MWYAQPQERRRCHALRLTEFNGRLERDVQGKHAVTCTNIYVLFFSFCSTRTTRGALSGFRPADFRETLR